MKPTIREILADTHVPAIAVALLLVWSLEEGIVALRDPVFYAAGYLFTAIGILGIPYSSPGFSRWERIITDSTLEYFYYAIIELIAAWLLSRWAYGTGPFRCLNTYWIWLNGRNRA
jgi:hypothetical protein